MANAIKTWRIGNDRNVQGRHLMRKHKVSTGFLEVQKALTLKGNIVLSVGLFGHSGDDEAWTEGTKEMLDDMHKRKIDMSDEIFVINRNGYIGESTRSEIAYAKETHKPVIYLEDPNGE